jgi:hypothetical protein
MNNNKSKKYQKNALPTKENKWNLSPQDLESVTGSLDEGVENPALKPLGKKKSKNILPQ